mmetsp:Transcript_7565/g.31455  ORF Transcript_7565/g.31455 Transcript_7565/m.31455 type:complete len:228 (+) Transcript_7565:1828-2511(+)
MNRDATESPTSERSPSKRNLSSRDSSGSWWPGLSSNARDASARSVPMRHFTKRSLLLSTKKGFVDVARENRASGAAGAAASVPSFITRPCRMAHMQFKISARSCVRSAGRRTTPEPSRSFVSRSRAVSNKSTTSLIQLPWSSSGVSGALFIFARINASRATTKSTTVSKFFGGVRSSAPSTHAIFVGIWPSASPKAGVSSDPKKSCQLSQEAYDVFASVSDDAASEK